MIRGGGAKKHGGKRENAGRHGGQSTNWKQYKPMGKKETEKLRKENWDINKFLVPVKRGPKGVNSDGNIFSEGKLKKLKSAISELLFANNIHFFKNGCFADQADRISIDNYTCAIDSLISVGENMLINCSESGIEIVGDMNIMDRIKEELFWRLNNDFVWKHSLRNPL